MVAKKKSKKKVVRKKATKKSNAGRPSKFDTANIELMKFMYEHGYTDKQVALKIGVAESTLHLWKIANPTFSESLKDWKLNADGVVEASLYQRANGYDTIETKVFCDSKTGRVTTYDVIKHYAPDPASIIFWLKNRKPNKWKDKREITVDPENIKKIFAFDLKDKPEG